MKPALALRVSAAQAAVDRFRDKPLRWGVADCGIMVRHVGRQLGNKISLLDGANYRSEIGAAKFLRTLGHEGLAPVMDALGYMPIPPAMRLPSDVVAVATDGDLWDCALTISVSGSRLFGFVDGVGATFEPTGESLIKAWRIPLCRR